MEGGAWSWVLEQASTYGYTFLFLISIAENTFLLGLVVPGDVAVVLGGALSASGRLEPVTVAAVVIAGAIVGGNLSFWIGRRGGVMLVERSAKRFGIDGVQIERVERYFVAHGAKTVFLASFVAGLKNLVPALAGASKMGPVRFFGYNTVGAALRSALLVAVGYIFGASAPAAVRFVGSLNVWIFVVLLTFVSLRVLYGWHKGRRGVDPRG